MNYVKTFEHFSFGGDLNEATEESVKNLQDRITQLQKTGEKLASKDWKDLLDKKKRAIDSAKEKKDSLKTQLAEREYNLVQLKMKKSMLRQDMIKKELVFLQSKVEYQTQSVELDSEIEKIKATK
jgi:hypothetical protein